MSWRLVGPTRAVPQAWQVAKNCGVFQIPHNFFNTPQERSDVDKNGPIPHKWTHIYLYNQTGRMLHIHVGLAIYFHTIGSRFANFRARNMCEVSTRSGERQEYDTVHRSEMQAILPMLFLLRMDWTAKTRTFWDMAERIRTWVRFVLHRSRITPTNTPLTGCSCHCYHV